MYANKKKNRTHIRRIFIGWRLRRERLKEWITRVFRNRKNNIAKYAPQNTLEHNRAAAAAASADLDGIVIELIIMC